ncbi:hypothetical protein GCM10023220_64600 [Streptomyces ziwulingensis]|uniref:Secreted protein n=1 Tax=Streptomyces ziwulingensis TaxID=1045501 RepID=A0ABP9CY05_9ACTN
MYPVDQVLVFVYAAPTPAAWAEPVSSSAPPPATAAATTAPIALFLPLILRRCVLIACLPSLFTGFPDVGLGSGEGVRQHASRGETGKVPDPGGGR